MIPAEAVEAAALALHERHEIKGVYVDDVRRILEAAAPHMLAAAWDEGFMTAAEWPNEGTNPHNSEYRSAS